MEGRVISARPLAVVVLLVFVQDAAWGMNLTEKRQLKDKVVEMFNHAYSSYMYYAYPADELMPISCKGRGRGTEPSRGDIDDVLGNFSLTLIDTLDTLLVLGQVDEFENAVRKVIQDVSFDSDIVVSVFETNIRVLGGLLGGHVLAQHLKIRKTGMLWYSGELLEMARDIGMRLLPAFNTSTGIPYPRVNLRYGVKPGASRTGHEKDTCTACAGTMILEFAALSRLTGDPIFENKARHAMEFLWKMRHRSSDLVGTVINIHNGDWVRRESGVGAGIDSYYEYMLKAYILLADDTYLDRFNKHYAAVMRYVSQGPMMVDVHMHKPLSNSRNFMDALLAFWPGLQVLKGDLKSAIETHEMLYQVTQRHNFLPEAFTTDFRVHWGQHPLRPEFVESTYFIYKATGDPYYLEVGKTVIDNLESHARVQCGFAAIKDVTTGAHEDQMDSYVLAETFKYLYLLFSEREDLILDIDNYIFTTEAHLLPLTLSTYTATPNNTANVTYAESDSSMLNDQEDSKYDRTCPNTPGFHTGTVNYAHSLRQPLKNLVERVCPTPRERNRARLRASDFIAGNKDQLEELRRMGIRIATMKDGRVQLLHTASEAATPDDAEDGMLFMQEMIDLSKQQQQEVQQEPRVVQLLSPPFFGNLVLNAGPAQFGYDLKLHPPVHGHMLMADPLKACRPLLNSAQLKGRIAVMERGDCMFIDKARQIQTAGAVGGVVIDHNEGTNSETSPLFAMSGDGRNDITIPMLFLFHQQGQRLYEALEETQNRVLVMMGYKQKPAEDVMKLLLDIRKAAKLAVASEEGDQSEGIVTMTDQSQHSSPSSGDQSQAAEDQAAQDQSKETTESAVPSESEATKLLLNMYMKKMNLGEIEVQIAENRQWNKEAESLLQIIEGPNKDKHTSVQLDNLVTSETELKISRVYQELVKLLMSHTNLDGLAERGNYLKALEDLVETAFTQGERGLDVQAQATLDRLAKELRPRPRDTKDEGEKKAAEIEEEGREQLIRAVERDATKDGSKDEGKEAQKVTRHFYLSERDLEGEDEDAKRATIVRKAQEWMGLQDGEVMVDRNGVMYINDGYDFEDEALAAGDALVKPEGASVGEDSSSSSSSGSEEQTNSRLNYHAMKRNFAAHQEILRERSHEEQKETGGLEPEDLQVPQPPGGHTDQSSPAQSDTLSSTVETPDIIVTTDSDDSLSRHHAMPSQHERTSETQREALTSPKDGTDPPPSGRDGSVESERSQDQTPNRKSPSDEL